MASTRSARVENGLQSLLQRLVPAKRRDESEDSADQRWDDAYTIATELLEQGEAERIPSEDVNHAADLIRRRLMRGGGPEKATAFANLYSRLLTQPVLSKKWGILYFLLMASEQEDDQVNGRAKGNTSASDQTGAHQPQYSQGQRSERSSVYEARNGVYDEAFARNGLPRLSSSHGPNSPTKSPVKDPERPAPARPRQQESESPTSPAKNREPTDLLPTEAALLRDLPFTLQGLSSTNLLFADKKSLKLPTTLPVPLVSLLHTLAEPALLYRSLSAFVDSTEGGLVGQSLRAAIDIELRSYLGLVGTLEGQIRRALTQYEENPSSLGVGKAGVTLKRCVVWTREPTLGLRLMSIMVESAQSKSGGQLISLIHGFSSSHGDPFVHNFAERLLTNVTKPFYSMLRAWVYDGELEDPHGEFFVIENRNQEDNVASNVWEHQYLLKESMVPSIMTLEFAKRVFLIGKSLNFIRYGCGDSGWVESYSKSASRELEYGDTTSLSSSIDEAYKTVMARLINLMENKFALFSHLQALKRYLLLGQGDFIELLMESLASNLDRPANSQYRHTLTAQLEHAIRNSNAQYDGPDVLRRLDARMLELSHGEIGWDVFTLEYRIDAPLDVVITPWANRQYLKVFNFLWRVKRVEFALSTTWRRLQTGARGVLGAVHDKLGAEWKTARGGLARMIHFIDQLQYYILFEVIEAGWEELQQAMRKPEATLDTLIEAHTTYLKNITRKGLLGHGGSLEFTTQLHELLKLMLAYRDAVDSLYSYSVAEFTRRQELAAKIETRTKAGRWGLSEADDDAAPSPLFPSATARARDADSPFPPLLPLQDGVDGDRNMLDQLRRRLSALLVDFSVKTNVLLGDLAYQPDADMRFLAVVMNFNNVYSPVRRRKPQLAPQKNHDSSRSSVAGSVARRPGSKSEDAKG